AAEAEDALPEEAPRKRRQRKAEKQSLPEGADASPDEAPKKRRQRKVARTEADGDDESQASGGRTRGGKGQKRARTKAAKQESADEEGPDEESLAAWKQLLSTRAGSEDLRLAFSLRPMTPQELRQLGPEAYLGKKKEPGAQPIFNRQGKVNLQFFLASYKASEKRREADKDAANPHYQFLRWLIKQARELRVLNQKEVRRGQISKPRLEQAKSTGYTFAGGANLAQASDDEGRQRKKDPDEREKQASADILQRELRFPERVTSESQLAESSERLRQQLRNQAESRKDKIKAHSSNGRDLQSMSSILTAPSLSFDWVEPESDEENNPNGILQVDLPDSAKSSDKKRALLRETIQRSVSFKQAEVLNAKATRSLSSASLSNGKSPGLAEADKLADKLADKIAKAKKDQTGAEPSAAAAEAPEAEEVAEAAVMASGMAAPAPPEAEAATLPAVAGSAASETADLEASATPHLEAGASSLGRDVTELPTDEVPAEGKAPSPDLETAIAKDEGLVSQVAAPPGDDLDVSATLPFEVILEPAEKGPHEAPGEDVDLSATQPFEVVLGDAEVSEDKPADTLEHQATSEALKVGPDASWDAQPPSSEEEGEEDANMSAAERRECAWLRHQRQKRREEEDKENQKLKSKVAKVGRHQMRHSADDEEEDGLFLGNRANRQRSSKRGPMLLLRAAG
ncbi:unnamed protein product, partial [Symbiodinium pilosum]